MNVVSLYGQYGNNEANSSPEAIAHYQEGLNRANQIQALGTDGTVTGPNPAIVFLFIGFSNCDIEICGGDSDAWDGQRPNHLAGQPCATQCPNLNFPDEDHPNPWNQVTRGGGDGTTQNSFLYQIYHPSQHLVGPNVVVFNAALGGQSLVKWDTNQLGFYAHTYCDFGYGASAIDPECNYDRVPTI